MSYTVNKLAKLSGVSVRTLRFYDEIRLLKPAYYGDNNYRYYEEKQLLRLQQILFFRELGFALNDIQRMLCDEEFNHIDALISHKRILEQSLDRTKNLIMTIDKTIEHLRGKSKMKDKELYYGFDSEEQKEHEKYLVKEGIVSQVFLDDCNDKVKNWTDSEKNIFLQDVGRIMNSLIAKIDENVAPSDKKVQDLMQQHYQWLQRSWTPNKEKYLGLAELYQTPEFRKFYDSRHPKLLEYMVAAMTIFAEHKLC